MIMINIAIINSRREKPRSIWDLGFGIWDSVFRVSMTPDSDVEGSDLRDVCKSQFPIPNSQIVLPVTVFLSIQAFFIGRRTHVKNIYVIPAVVVLGLVG